MGVVKGSVPAPSETANKKPALEKARRGLGRLHLIALLVFVAVLASAPLWVTSDYQYGILNQASVYVVLAVGFYFVFGLSGQFNFAHGGFFALGAVVSARVAGSGQFWTGFVAAIVVTAVVGAAFRAALGRVSAIYFAIATFALNGIILLVVQNWEWLSGGFAGLSGLAPPTFFGIDLTLPGQIYWLYAGIAVASVGLGMLIETSPFRRYVVIARDNRGILKTLGVDAGRVELVVFTLSCAYAGAAGSMYAHMISFLSGFSFSDTISLNIFLMVVMGGISIIWGAVIGAYLLTWLPELLRGFSEQAHLIYALLLIIVLLVVPLGITGVLQRIWKLVHRA